MSKIFTEGTNYNVECPYCGGNNHYVCQNVKIPFREIVFFKKKCTHCYNIIDYIATWDITVRAEKA